MQVSLTVKLSNFFFFNKCMKTTAAHSPCEQRRAPSQRPSSALHKGDQSTWAEFLGVSSCHSGTESWPGPAEGTPLSPPLPKVENTSRNDKKERTLQYSNNK